MKPTTLIAASWLPVLLSSCSLLFSASDVDVNLDAGVDVNLDAGVGDDAGMDLDPNANYACPTGFAGTALPGTLLHLALEGPFNDLPEIDFEEKSPGLDVALRASAFLFDILAVEPPYVASANGPVGDCNNAVDLSTNVEGNSKRYIEIPHTDVFSTIKSIDFWFQPTDGVAAESTLLTKDATLSHDGDLSIKIRGVNEENVAIRVRLQTIGPEYFLCTPLNIAKNTWHHFVLSLGSQVEMFVDGEAVRTPCSGSAMEPEKQWIASNQYSWTWGASNSSRPATHIRQAFVGYLDELRFRTTPFTVEEAQVVWNRRDP